MPALNFMKKWAPDVEAGIKRCTIRKKRKDDQDPKPGQTLFLYTGMRTKCCRKLREDICLESVPILIDQSGTRLNGLSLHPVDEYKLAKADGFKSVREYLDFFLKGAGTQFEGFLIKW